MLDLSKATPEQFEPRLNERFPLAVDSGEPIELELIAVETKGSAAPEGMRQAFSLVFRGPKELDLPQQTFALSNETLGSLVLFLVPVGADDMGMLYEAVFT